MAEGLPVTISRQQMAGLAEEVPAHFLRAVTEQQDRVMPAAVHHPFPQAVAEQGQSGALERGRLPEPAEPE